MFSKLGMPAPLLVEKKVTMTYKEFNFIKDAFSQIIDDIAGNPDWYEASRAVASDLGELERELKEKFL